MENNELNIIENLYHGKICPTEKRIKSDEFKKLQEKSQEIKGKLIKTLEDEEKKLLEELIETEYAISSIDCENKFSVGDKMGVQLIIAGLE